jgi:hypothetical protein
MFLADIRKLLAVGGVLVTEVPCVDMRVHSKIRGDDSPHFLFFSKDSLRKLLEVSGFDILVFDTCTQTYAEQSCDAMQREGIKTMRRGSIIRRIFEGMPMPAQHLVRQVFSKYNDRTIDFNQDNFAYGGDRTGLRVVACPRNS